MQGKATGMHVCERPAFKGPPSSTKVRGCLVFKKTITHHSLLNFCHSSLITHQLKYPNSLNPARLAPITQLCFQPKN